MSDLKRWKQNIINEALALHRDHGPDAGCIILATSGWSEDHPLTGDDARVPPFFRQNYDYGSGEGLQGQLDEYRKRAAKSLKKRVYEAYALDSAIPTEAYCGKERNRKYWKSAGSSKAVRDFLKYIEQVSC
jgi:hypothetical protein